MVSFVLLAGRPSGVLQLHQLVHPEIFHDGDSCEGESDHQIQQVLLI